MEAMEALTDTKLALLHSATNNSMELTMKKHLLL